MRHWLLKWWVDFLRIGVTWACLKNSGHFPCSSEAFDYWSDEDVQIIKDKKCGPREQDLLREFMMILATWSSVTVKKLEKWGGGGGGGGGVKGKTNLSAQSWGGFMNGNNLSGSQCNTSPRTCDKSCILRVICNYNGTQVWVRAQKWSYSGFINYYKNGFSC